MSDEEKEAIEELKNKKADYFMISDLTSKTILNLIEKQSKEIEELKDTRSIFNMGRRSYKNEIEYKIKAKIEEINKEMLNEENSLEIFYRKKYCKEVLKSLLEKE